MRLKTEVLIAGGGATGAGIARDLSLRGIPCVLLEKGDLTSGASGRNHGLLHSGGRYAVSDPEAARECITENRILKAIAPHCTEETGGLFVSLPEDGLDFRDRFLEACAGAGIEAAALSGEEALALEPALHPEIVGAVRVPDGAVDPFMLILENIRDAEAHGARILLHTEVTGLAVEAGRVKEIRGRDLLSGEEVSVEASFVVNATGAWANDFLGLAGLRIAISLSKGSLLVTNRRVSERVINRCRPPSNGDIIVPNDVVSIIGTTSVRLETVEHDVTAEEVSVLIRQSSRMIPSLRRTRFIRAYAGVRPLFLSEAKGDDRTVSRGFALIDHGPRDGVSNLLTISGGKLITYRLMAEKTADLLCSKLGVGTSCTTASTPLPGALRGGGFRERFKASGRGEILCDCELVGRDEVEARLREEKMRDFRDLLHRTRLAKGTCQGGFCVYRLLGVLHDLGLAGHEMRGSNELLKGFLEERWRGVRPVLWGVAVREEELLESIYKGLFNL